MLWLSLGENCLPDAILKRHGLKAFSTPFSSARSNIDIATDLTLRDFDGFMDRNNLTEPLYDGGRKYYRSTVYCGCEDIFEANSRAFEFSHHDVIENARHIDSFKRKIDRWRSLRQSDQPVTFLYYHRYTRGMSLEKLTPKLLNFLNVFRRSGNARIVAFVQRPMPSDRGVTLSAPSHNLRIVEFRTARAWGGAERDIWALDDDDLIADALRQSAREQCEITSAG